MTDLRYGTLCSGIEAAALAAPASWQQVWCSEIDRFACALLSYRRSHVPNLGDMTADDMLHRAKALGRVDVLIAGTPCQAFSVAGHRRSLADDRGNLTLRFVEIANECDPAWIVWENVPGVLNTDDNAFGCFLAGLVGHPEPIPPGGGAPIGRWANAGMVVGPRRAACWRVLDAQYFGLAQRRRRVYVVARRAGNGSGCAAVLLEPESLPGHPPTRQETRPDLARTLTASTGGSSGKEQQHTFIRADGEPLNALHCPDVSPALKARDCKGPSSDGDGDGAPLIAFDTTQITSPGNYSHPKPGAPCHPLASQAHPPAVTTHLGVRRLTPLECERLQGFPDNWTRIPYRNKPADQCPDGHRYHAIGDAMPVPVMRWILHRVDTVHTLPQQGTPQ